MGHLRGPERDETWGATGLRPRCHPLHRLHDRNLWDILLDLSRQGLCRDRLGLVQDLSGGFDGEDNSCDRQEFQCHRSRHCSSLSDQLCFRVSAKQQRRCHRSGIKGRFCSGPELRIARLPSRGRRGSLHAPARGSGLDHRWRPCWIDGIYRESHRVWGRADWCADTIHGGLFRGSRGSLVLYA